MTELHLRKHLLELIGGIVFVFAGTSAHAVVINFDDGTSGSPIDAFYAGLGVTFSNTQWNSFGTLAGGSPPLAISAIVGAGGQFQPDVTTPLVATFASGVSSVGITALDVGEHGARIDAYDSVVGGSLIAFDEAFGPGVGVGFFFELFATDTAIRRIELYQPSQFLLIGDGVVWDNLSFVPEPATVLLMGIGLIGLGFSATRSRRKRLAA